MMPLKLSMALLTIIGLTGCQTCPTTSLKLEYTQAFVKPIAAWGKEYKRQHDSGIATPVLATPPQVYDAVGIWSYSVNKP